MGDLQLQANQIEDLIDSWDLQEEDSQLSNADIVAREEARSKHVTLSLNIARKWGQS